MILTIAFGILAGYLLIRFLPALLNIAGYTILLCILIAGWLYLTN